MEAATAADPAGELFLFLETAGDLWKGKKGPRDNWDDETIVTQYSRDDDADCLSPGRVSQLAASIRDNWPPKQMKGKQRKDYQPPAAPQQVAHEQAELDRLTEELAPPRRRPTPRRRI